jgi:spore coat protein A, manganese oxidase
MMLSRRGFLKLTAAGGAATFLASRARFLKSALAAQSPQIPLAGSAIPKFVEPVPGLGDLGAINATAGTGPLGASQITLNMAEFQAQVLPAAFYTALPAPYNAGTYVWGYLQTGQAGRSTYLGPVILAQRGVPVEMKFVNSLGSVDTTMVDAYKYGTDQTLHWADPLNNEANMWNHMAMPPMPNTEGASNYGQDPATGLFTGGPIPACVHLHGGEVPPVLDGGPDAWFTSDGAYKGHAFYSADGAAAGNYNIYRYPNSQEGSPIWFHDHTLGATRLNVYCGLAGGYLVLDPANDPQNLPEGPVPLIIQDRSFDTNGQLFFPSDTAGGLQWALNPEHPYWVPEFVGDVICVNGKAWPYLSVSPKRYTFLFLNGSNARSYDMFLIDPVSGNRGPAFWIIGTDGGYLDKPVKVGPPGNNNSLVMMSGERYLVIIDFAGYQAGVIGPNGLPYSGNWLLKNQAKTPFPNGAAATGATTGQVMQFRVLGAPGGDTSFNPAVAGATLRGGVGQGPAVVRLVNPATGTLATTAQKTRQLTLNEVMGMPQNATNPVNGLMTAYPGGPLEILVNNTKWNGERINGVMTDPMTGHMMYTFETRPDFTPDGTGMNWLSELPKEGETEVWEIINLTADAHPIHTHLVQFQLMNRQVFDTKAYSAAYNAAFPGGGWNNMVVPPAPYLAGVYIPGFGPPLDYNNPIPSKPTVVGGNPDIDALNPKGKPLYLKGTPTPPLPQEAGWKDTVVVYPGQVTRFVVRWAPTDLPASTPPSAASFPFDPNGGHGYVWHCHIVDHEDNEMMRPDEVVPNAGATRTYIKGVDY